MLAKRSSSIVTVLAIFAIAGGSKTTAQEKKPSAAQSSPSVVPLRTVKVPAEDPCQLLTDAEVGQVFPGAKIGKRERNEDLGFVACTWNSPGGYIRVQIFNREPGISIEEEIELYTAAFVGSFDPEALRAVRLETVNNVGDHALAAVERADAPRIIQDAAVIVVQRGQRTIYISSAQLAKRERIPALKALEELARAAAKRL